MTSFRVRPKFKIISDKSIDELVELINQKTATPQQIIEGKVYPSHGLLRIRPEHQHYWSPQLNITFEPIEDNKTIIRGMYGPHPSVWAMFLMAYVLLGMGVIVVSMIGFVRMNLNLSSNILWFLPALLGGLVTLWLLAQAGQKIGAEQTFAIHHFFEEAIQEPVHINPIR